MKKNQLVRKLASLNEERDGLISTNPQDPALAKLHEKIRTFEKRLERITK